MWWAYPVTAALVRVATEMCQAGSVISADCLGTDRCRHRGAIGRLAGLRRPTAGHRHRARSLVGVAAAVVVISMPCGGGRQDLILVRLSKCLACPQFHALDHLAGNLVRGSIVAKRCNFLTKLSPLALNRVATAGAASPGR